MTEERTCPICESSFTPKAVTSLTCSAPCSKEAKKLREAIKAFNAGERELRPKTLELAMRLLEADEVITAAKAQRKAAEVLDDEAEDPAEDEHWRNAYAAEQAMQRKWMADWRAARLRLIARGHRPMWVTPCMIEEAYKRHPGGLPPLTY
ncbi:hypothetical protein RBY4I_2125 [Rhodobacterales bacterium Y4I]|nr:hypothetical protein RBY4I_2125 [Rhodobacterales bacterium Y4I]